MKDFMDILLSPDVLFIYGLIFVMIAAIVCILVFDKKGKKKHLFIEEDEEEDEEEVELVEAPTERVKPKVENVRKPEEVERVTTSLDKVEQEVKYVDPVLDQTSAQIELQKLTEALEKREEPDVNSIISEFESEQEENAIISLEELLQRGKQMYSKNEVTQYEDEGPISIDELKMRYEEEKVEKTEKVKEPIRPVVNMNLDMMDESKDLKQRANQTSFDFDDKKFRTSPVISPVFGLYQDRSNSKVTASVRPSDLKGKEVSSPSARSTTSASLDTSMTNDYQLALENTANYDKLDEEIRKTNEFLRQLRELQKKLD